MRNRASANSLRECDMMEIITVGFVMNKTLFVCQIAGHIITKVNSIEFYAI